MKKILFVANIHNHFNAFHLPHIAWLKEQGFEVHCAANGPSTSVKLIDKQYIIPIQRNLWSLSNFKALRQLKQIIETENYDLVHCHTSMGGAIGRLASAHNRRLGKTRVLFTSHEFPFYENWALKNWLTYYPIESLLSLLADGIISINQFDFKILNSAMFKCKYKYKITSIGVDVQNFQPVTITEKSNLRRQYGFTEDDYILIYAAEHTVRKNHKFIIDAMPLIIKDLPNIKVLFTGRGVLLEQNVKLAKANRVDQNVIFTGYVKSIKDYMALADVGISSSLGEGLGINLVEELFLGKPIIASNNKGHREIVINGINGFMYNKGDYYSFVNFVKELYYKPHLLEELSTNAPRSAEKFSTKVAVSEMSDIYNFFLK